jgi:hypothetical protein
MALQLRTFLVVKNIVWLDKFVVGTLNNSHTGLLFVIESAQAERHGASFGIDFGEDSTGSLHLQGVLDASLLVDGGSGFTWLDL